MRERLLQLRYRLDCLRGHHCWHRIGSYERCCINETHVKGARHAP